MTSDAGGSQVGSQRGSRTRARGAASWIASAATSWLLLVYLLLASEWLFQVTQVSFFSFLPWSETLRVLALAPLPLVLCGWAAMAVLALPALAGRRLTARPFSARRPLARLCLALLPACALSALAFLLVDNFTATVFGFGSLSLRGPARLVYGVVWAGLLTAALLRGLDSLERPIASWRRVLAVALLGASAAVWLWLPRVAPLVPDLAIDTISGEDTVGTARPAAPRPDVFLLSAEALAADQLADLFDGRSDVSDDEDGGSDAGLPTLSSKTLIFQNAFANANRTAGSVPVLVTGRHPLTVRKLNGRHRLHGADSYRHLPGLLAGLGYRSYLQGPRLHVDPVAWQLRRGFDVYNGRPVDPGGVGAVLAAAGGRLDSTAYFLELVGRRLADRLLHATGFDLAELPSRPNDAPPDVDVFAAMDEFLHTEDGPVLLVAHLVGRPADHDAYLRRLLDSQSTRRRPLLVVFGSDHGPDHEAELRVPLLLRLPTGQGTAGADLRANAQNLDIAPTVLDALGLEVPGWMEGRSLLRPRPPLRPVFVVSSSDEGRGLPLTGVAEGGPRRLAMVVCQRLASLDLLTGELDVRDVAGHTAPCDPADLPTPAAMREQILEFLRRRDVPVEPIPDARSAATSAATSAAMSAAVSVCR